MARLLVVDDDPDVVDFISKALEPWQLSIDSAGSGEAALLKVAERAPDAMLLDLVLPGIDGLETLRRLRARGHRFPVVLITSHGALDTTLEAMQLGAWDYVAKPIRVCELETIVERCLGDRLHPVGVEADSDKELAELVLLGQSAAMVQLYKAIAYAAGQNDPLLIVGETGTGKRLVAHAVHRHSARSGPWLVLDCGSAPEAELDRIVFGSGGMLERARQGTLFLQSIEQLPPGLQRKLERVLEQPGPPPRARIITAIQEEGEPVPSLPALSRLAETQLRIPPLRERADDVRLLIDACLERMAPRSSRTIASVEPAAYARLQRYSWPANLRELWEVLTRALAAGTGPVLLANELPALEEPDQDAGNQADRLATVEQTHIARVLEECGWNQSTAARRLGIHRNTLRRKIREYRLHPNWAKVELPAAPTELESSVEVQIEPPARRRP